nr:DUF1810 family protein [uncultured Pedobacter sp.]
MIFDLERFKTAQSKCYPQVVSELRNGKKESHWIWFVFPQISGLGKSEIAKKYEIKNPSEAYAYLTDDLLSKRILELTGILAYEIKGKSAEEIFGFPDYLKFHSSLTLFNAIVKKNLSLSHNPVYNCFEDALAKYYNSKYDHVTLEILKKIHDIN